MNWSNRECGAYYLPFSLWRLKKLFLHSGLSSSGTPSNMSRPRTGTIGTVLIGGSYEMVGDCSTSASRPWRTDSTFKTTDEDNIRDKLTWEEHQESYVFFGSTPHADIREMSVYWLFFILIGSPVKTSTIITGFGHKNRCLSSSDISHQLWHRRVRNCCPSEFNLKVNVHSLLC